MKYFILLSTFIFGSFNAQAASEVTIDNVCPATYTTKRGVFSQPLNSYSWALPGNYNSPYLHTHGIYWNPNNEVYPLEELKVDFAHRLPNPEPAYTAGVRGQITCFYMNRTVKHVTTLHSLYECKVSGTNSLKCLQIPQTNFPQTN